jgi:hypothetical protein
MQSSLVALSGVPFPAPLAGAAMLVEGLAHGQKEPASESPGFRAFTRTGLFPKSILARRKVRNPLYGGRRLPNYSSVAGMTAMDELKLIALDRDDLEIVSTHLQDAVVKVGDILWRPSEKRLVMALNRFDWECAFCGRPHFQRRRTALRFERVSACKCKDVTARDPEVVLNLLAIEFDENNAPGGCITLYFSGGGAMRLEVECLEAELSDLGPVWETTCCPAHTEELKAAEARLSSVRDSGA